MLQENSNPESPDKAYIALIENAPLTLSDRIDTLLVYCQEKPATEVMIYKTEDSSPIGKACPLDEGQIEEVASILEKLGLFYKVGDMRSWKRGQYGPVEFVDIALARDESTLSRFAKAKENGDERELERLYGFPESAISAYLGEVPACRYEEILDYIGPSPLAFFTNYVFSREKYEEEIENTSKRWHEAVKRLSPKLYEMI
ncbi:MAG: hypothetical protein JW727_04975 [Candidatus Aenigmarchaeota archaeon]|nr:hypothetical protein [Candidatus Aenigmarchaeota archaeon]